MEFLIDRKFWNNVIKKADPTMALDIKNALKKKKENYSTYLTPQKTWATTIEPDLKKELILNLPNEKINYGFCSELIREGGKNFNRWDLIISLKWKKPNKKYLDLEKSILEVLIETKGLPPNVKYDVFGEIIYIVEQDQNLELVDKGFVYLIRNDDIYKIGITDNLLRRFNQLKPDEVLNVVRCSNFEKLEKDLHKKFKEFRIPQTEYFRLNKNQIEEVNIEMTKGANF